MSVISLLTEQLKNTLNKTTKDLIISISEQFNLSNKELLNTWNDLNPEFKHNFNHVIITIEDDEEIVVKKPRIEDDEEIIIKKPRIIIED